MSPKIYIKNPIWQGDKLKVSISGPIHHAEMGADGLRAEGRTTSGGPAARGGHWRGMMSTDDGTVAVGSSGEARDWRRPTCLF